ncbi:MAG: hypothetical protein KIC37_05095 [Coriobacteriaceae bacterium]|nr:hypothetical protein [Coriobacteriaceae bacterium]
MATLDIVSYLRKTIHQRTNLRVPEIIPENLPDEFVLVSREGGHRLDALRDRPGIRIECYARTESKAKNISDIVSELLCALPRYCFKDGIATVKEEIRYSDYDDKRLRSKWYASYTITTYKPKETG